MSSNLLSSCQRRRIHCYFPCFLLVVSLIFLYSNVFASCDNIGTVSETFNCSADCNSFRLSVTLIGGRSGSQPVCHDYSPVEWVWIDQDGWVDNPPENEVHFPCSSTQEQCQTRTDGILVGSPIFMPEFTNCSWLGETCPASPPLGADGCPSGQMCEKGLEIILPSGETSYLCSEPLSCIQSSPPSEWTGTGGYGQLGSECPTGYSIFEDLESGSSIPECITSVEITNGDFQDYGTNFGFGFNGSENVSNDDAVPVTELNCPEFRQYTWGANNEKTKRCCVTDASCIPMSGETSGNDSGSSPDTGDTGDTGTSDSIDGMNSNLGAKLDVVNSNIVDTNTKLDEVKDSIDSLKDPSGSDYDFSGFDTVTDQLNPEPVDSEDWNVSSLVASLTPDSLTLCPVVSITSEFMGQSIDASPYFLCDFLAILRVFVYIFFLLISVRVVLTE